MIRLFVTGDNHIGRKFDRYPNAKEKLVRSRFECLRKAVREADDKDCAFFIVTGDLFDNISSIPRKDVKEVVEILSGFDGGRVIVLPGNHDFYTGEEKVWKDFQDALNNVEHNIFLLTEMREYLFDVGEEKVIFYPAVCQSKHSETNNLGWIKNLDWANKREAGGSVYHIGLAHGAIAGVTPDMKNEYFLMTEKELRKIPVDAWLIGHTHVPYPADLQENADKEGYTIFNPGTHAQTDLSNHTEGYCFIVKIDCQDGKKRVFSRKYCSGEIGFFDLSVDAAEKGLDEGVREAVADKPDNSILRIRIDGAISEQEYAERNRIIEEAKSRFLACEIEDSGLCESISPEKIREEFAEIGLAAKWLNVLEDPWEIQMAYELIKKHQK